MSLSFKSSTFCLFRPERLGLQSEQWTPGNLHSVVLWPGPLTRNASDLSGFRAKLMEGALQSGRPRQLASNVPAKPSLIARVSPSSLSGTAKAVQTR
jgi:hypothetical protein